jgi:HSP20 family protein
MRARVHVVGPPLEISEFAEEVRLIFAELGGAFGADSLAGECSPAIDVYETDEAVEITVDLPGVNATALRVMGKGDSVLIAGEKPARGAHGESSYHLVERGYGRFARVVRLARACDLARAGVKLSGGELRVTVPKIRERRGRAIPIAIEA